MLKDVKKQKPKGTTPRALPASAVYKFKNQQIGWSTRLPGGRSWCFSGPAISVAFSRYRTDSLVTLSILEGALCYSPVTGQFPFCNGVHRWSAVTTGATLCLHPLGYRIPNTYLSFATYLVGPSTLLFSDGRLFLYNKRPELLHLLI